MRLILAVPSISELENRSEPRILDELSKVTSDTHHASVGPRPTEAQFPPPKEFF